MSSGVKDDKGRGDGFVFSHAYTCDGALMDRRVSTENSFDLHGRNPIPESGYDVVLSSHQPQIPVFIFGEAIAADKPLSTKHLGSLFGPLPVVKHDSRIVLGSGEDSRLSCRDLFPRFINEQRAVPGLRLSWRAGFNGHSGHI